METERARKDKDRNHPKLHMKRITSTNQGQKTLKCGCTPLFKAQWHAKALCLPHAPAITVSLMIQEQKDGVQQWESDALERLLGLDRADTRSGAKVLLNPFPICPIVYPFKFSQLLLLLGEDTYNFLSSPHDYIISPLLSIQIPLLLRFNRSGTAPEM